MEIVSIILENPLAVAIITAIVSAFLKYLDKGILNYNIKKNQTRDEKIAYISEEIVKTRFGGYGSRNIEKYLLELESVLDLCGKQNQYDYIHDGHIWKIIEDIKRSSTETEFEKNKQILIRYLTLAKNKGNQKQRLKIDVMVLTLIMDIVIGFIYISYFYFIFNIKDIMFIFGGTMTVILMCTLCILFVRDNMDAEEKNRISSRHIVGRRIGIYINAIIAILCFVLALVINYEVLSIYAPKVAVQNMLISEDNDKIYIYTEQKMELFESLKYSVGKETGKKVEFVSEKKELPIGDKDGRDTHSEQIVAEKMRDIADGWDYVIWLIIYIMMFRIIINMMNRRDDLKVYTDEIRMINYTYNEPYQEKTKIADDFINKAEQYYSQKNRKKYRKDISKCFKIAFWILEEQSWGLDKKIKYQKKMIENAEDYDELKLLEENLESVNKKMKEVKLLYCKRWFLF